MHLRLGVLALAVVFSGCTDSSPPADGPGSTSLGTHGAHDAAMHILAPNATLGDYWTWTSPQIEGPYTSVLAADNGNDWLMATDHPAIAWFNERFDIASLGAVRKADLAGSQGSTRVEFFQFPLMEGRNWTTTWDGEPMTVRVLDVANGIASLEARRADDTLYAAYTYKAAHGYFGQIQYYDETGTEVGYEATITAAGKGFTGDLLRWTYTTPLEFTGAVGQTNFAQNFPVPLDATDVYVDFILECTAGTFTGGVAPLPVVSSIAGLEPRGYGAEGGPCPQADSFSGPIGTPKETAPGTGPEQWGFSAFADPAAQGTLTMNIFIRTQETFQVA